MRGTCAVPKMFKVVTPVDSFLGKESDRLLQSWLSPRDLRDDAIELHDDVPKERKSDGHHDVCGGCFQLCRCEGRHGDHCRLHCTDTL